MARVARRLWLYLRHDFKEIAWPSSLPDTPEVVAQRVKSTGRRLSPTEVLKALREGLAEYRASFRVSFPDLYASDKAGDTDSAPDGRAEEQALKQELADTAKAGVRAARPYLRDIYESRAAAYRDGVRQFVLGYREAFRDALLQEAARLKRETPSSPDKAQQ